MMKVLLSAIAIMAASSSIADAQQVCGPRREVIDTIKSKYGETESWFGIVADGNEKAVMLLLTGRDGSWTLLLVRPDVACGIASGGKSTALFGDPA